MSRKLLKKIKKWFKMNISNDHIIMPAKENIMKYKLFILYLLLCFLITAAVLNGAQNKPKDLPQKHRK